MWKPSRRQRRQMEKALQAWEGNLSLGVSYLESRGITAETAARFRLGVVGSAEPGFEKYLHRLAIPYFDRAGVCGFEFRCLKDHDCKKVSCRKYLQVDGQELGLWNVLDVVDSDEDTMHICEGVLDGITLTQVVGNEPVGALSGVSKWAPYFPYLLQGFERVVLWADPDEAGDKMRLKFRQHVPSVDIVNLPAPDDVNSLFCGKGPESIRSLYIDEEDS